MGDTNNPTPAEEPRLGALYRAYRQELFRYLNRQLQDPAAAEDGVQQVFLQLWRREQVGALHEDIRGYLYTSAKNYVRQYWRGKCREEPRSSIVSHEGLEETELVADQPGSEDQVHYRQMLELAVDSLGDLPQQTRQIFALYYGNGMTYVQIAKTLNVSERTVERHMTKALARVRQALKGKYP